MIKIYILIGTILLTAAGGVYYKYSSMEARIEKQVIEISNQATTIQVMSENIELIQRVAIDDQKKAVFDAVANSKKETIKETINYDKNTTSNDIDSTKFYL